MDGHVASNIRVRQQDMFTFPRKEIQTSQQHNGTHQKGPLNKNQEGVRTGGPWPAVGARISPRRRHNWLLCMSQEAPVLVGRPTSMYAFRHGKEMSRRT